MPPILSTISIWLRSSEPRIFEDAQLFFHPDIGFVCIRVNEHDTYFPTNDVVRIDLEQNTDEEI